MNQRAVLAVGGLILLGLILGGCVQWMGQDALLSPMSDAPAEDYIVVFNKLPADLESTIASYGGTVRSVLEEIDAVLVSGDADFAAAIEGAKGFDALIPDVYAEWLPQIEAIEFSVEHIGADEGFFGYQWDMLAIDAPGAWDAGYTGAGVRIAILDTGIDPLHPDLAPNLNAALSASFVPYEPFIDDLDGHGSNVAGIAAAADNGYGVIGVAPNAEIIAIKVLDGSGSGSFGWLLEGILHAVAVDADIVNMSLGAYMSHNGYVMTNAGPVYVGASEIAEFVNLVRKTMNFAEKEGVLLVSSAGNDARDGTGDAGWMHVPSDLGGCLVVSATGPIGWAMDPGTDLDVFAVYSDYGPQVDFAAPGGNFDPTVPNYWWDFVLNCTNGQWYSWYAGTSQAAPHVAGVAALILEKNGNLNPAQVKQQLRHAADDLGKPGQDPYYGHGRVNAANAVD